MELSLQGAWIGVNHQRIFIRTAKGETVTVALDEAESLMHGLRDAIQTADHLSADSVQVEMPVKFGGFFEDLDNLIVACEGKPAA